MRYVVKFYGNKQHSCNNVFELGEYLHNLETDELREIYDIKAATNHTLHLCEDCKNETNVSLPLALVVDGYNLPIYKKPICDRCLCRIVGKEYIYGKSED